VGVVNGLAMYGPNIGTVIEVKPRHSGWRPNQGSIKVTGVMDEEEFGGVGRTMRRRSQARNSVDNVLTVLKAVWAFPPRLRHPYELPRWCSRRRAFGRGEHGHAMYSAISGKAVDNTVAMTGEVTIHGQVQGVGGIVAKGECCPGSGGQARAYPKGQLAGLFTGLSGIEVIPMSSM
jgi:Lon-like ATP-dependent protease